MIGPQPIIQAATRDGVRPQEVEKEYLQYAFLHSLAADTDGIVFRGGTMLRIAHGHPRYSEDLDFFRLHSDEEAEASIEAALSDLAHWGIRERHTEPEITKRHLLWKVEFKGPLYNTTGRENRIKIEVVGSGDKHLKEETAVIEQKYADVPLFTLPVQDRRETTAEKVRALVHRDYARDLYDLAFLVEQKHIPDASLVEGKLGWSRGAPRLRIQPHQSSDYERDLRDWVPARARMPWDQAWKKSRPFLEELRCVAVPETAPKS